MRNTTSPRPQCCSAISTSHRLQRHSSTSPRPRCFRIARVIPRGGKDKALGIQTPPAAIRPNRPDRPRPIRTTARSSSSGTLNLAVVRPPPRACAGRRHDRVRLELDLAVVRRGGIQTTARSSCSVTRSSPGSMPSLLFISEGKKVKTKFWQRFPPAKGFGFEGCPFLC